MFSRSSIQQYTRRWSERLVTPLARTGLTPNGLTVVGFLLNVAAGAMLASGAFIAGGTLVLVAGAFDMLDGALARVNNQKSSFGAFFDSTMDRMSEAAVLLGLLVAFLRTVDRNPYAEAGAILSFLVMVGSIMISYTRARAEGLHLDCEVGWLQRPERIGILGVGLLLPQAFLLAVLTALVIFTHVTVVQRVVHVWRLTRGE